MFKITKMKEKTEEFIDGMIEFFKGLEEDERACFAEDVCFNAALFGGFNYYESLGILDKAKAQLREAENNLICDECREKEETKLKASKGDRLN